MNEAKTRSLRNIEEKMEHFNNDSVRYHVLDCAKKFKTSWVEFGRALYSVWKDKLYKDWGYSTIEAYAAKEIGIKKQTAMKLLRSYYFLENEEPAYLRQDYADSAEASSIPSFESVDLLRQAKNKKYLDSEGYAHLKKEVFEKGKDHREVRKDLTALIKEREEFQPQQAYQKRRLAVIKRFLGALKTIKQEAEINKLLPAPLIREVSGLIKKLEEELS